MQINLSRDEIIEYAKYYDDDNRQFLDLEIRLSSRLSEAATRGHMNKDDLITTAKWKWKGGRTQNLCQQNSESYIEEVSRISFSTSFEQLRIGSLICLVGVQWPMASAILHFSFPNEYPILDFRAMKTVGENTIYNFKKWEDYTSLCRQKSRECNVTMRTLDKALWAFDKHRSK